MRAILLFALWTLVQRRLPCLVDFARAWHVSDSHDELQAAHPAAQPDFKPLAFRFGFGHPRDLFQ